MSRIWNQMAAVVIDVIGVFWFVVVTLVIAVAIGLLWHYFPRWLPRFGPRFARAKGGRKRRRRLRWPKLPRFRRRTRAMPAPEPAAVFIADTLPDLPVDVLRSRADAYAAEGRFAEAVRERLRAIVRELVDVAVIPHHPDWTVVELAGAAARVNPALAPALSGATMTFSDIWYGERPADQGSDQRMRAHDAAVHTIVSARVGAGR